MPLIRNNIVIMIDNNSVSRFLIVKCSYSVVIRINTINSTRNVSPVNRRSLYFFILFND